MGREIRMVPPNWEHPKEDKWNSLRHQTENRYKPMYDQSCEEAWAQWQSEYQDWLNGEHDRVIKKYGKDREYPKDQPYTSFCEWHGQPPDPAYYRPHWSEGTATWFQVYETVSEGTPVTPPFATQDELIEYLVANGDFWDQERRKERCQTMNCKPWPREQAERFVREMGSAPSLIVECNSEGVSIKSGVEACYGSDKTLSS